MEFRKIQKVFLILIDFCIKKQLFLLIMFFSHETVKSTRAWLSDWFLNKTPFYSLCSLLQQWSLFEVIRDTPNGR